MKKLLILFIILIGYSNVLLANDKNKGTKAEQELRNEIASLLDKPNVIIDKKELKANIEFTLNGKNEVVVLTVDSQDQEVSHYVKTRLNYKKVDVNLLDRKNKIFRITLTIKNPKDI